MEALQAAIGTTLTVHHGGESYLPVENNQLVPCSLGRDCPGGMNCPEGPSCELACCTVVDELDSHGPEPAPSLAEAVFLSPLPSQGSHPKTELGQDSFPLPEASSTPEAPPPLRRSYRIMTKTIAAQVAAEEMDTSTPVNSDSSVNGSGSSVLLASPTENSQGKLSLDSLCS